MGWLACALGHKACRENLSVLYQRASRLFAALALARGDGRYAKLLRQLARVDLLIIDDWGPVGACIHLWTLPPTTPSNGGQPQPVLACQGIQGLATGDVCPGGGIIKSWILVFGSNAT
jgi:hypothetical protein